MKASTSRRWLALALVGGVVGAMSLSPVLAGPNDPATKKFVRKVAKKVATKKANQAVAPLLAPKTGASLVKLARNGFYNGTITLGSVTPSFDLETEPVPAGEWQHLTESDIRAALSGFTSV